jgi:hypothetical protein
MTTDPIQKFILKDKDNFRIAATVGDAWPEITERIAVEFLDQLEIRLKRDVNNWHFERWERFFIHAYPCFMFWKPDWRGEYYMALQFGDYGQKISFGIQRDERMKHIQTRRRFDNALIAVKKIHPSAKSEPWWESKVFMRFPADNWRKPDVLWRMHRDKTFLKNVAEQLLEVAKVSTPIIDSLVRKFKK